MHCWGLWCKANNEVMLSQTETVYECNKNWGRAEDRRWILEKNIKIYTLELNLIINWNLQKCHTVIRSVKTGIRGKQQAWLFPKEKEICLQAPLQSAVRAKKANAYFWNVFVFVWDEPDRFKGAFQCLFIVKTRIAIRSLLMLLLAASSATLLIRLTTTFWERRTSSAGNIFSSPSRGLNVKKTKLRKI